MDEIVATRRGMILSALHAQFPYALTELMLEKAVGPFYAEGKMKGFAADISYLEGKALLTREENRVGERVYRAITITPKGADVVDGAITEPGIHFERG